MAKQKKCKVCEKKFTPFYSPLQQVCSIECSSRLAVKKVSAEKKKEKAQQKKKEQAERAKAKKEKLSVKPKSYWTAQLQMRINKIARLIDKGHPCISSGKYTGKMNGGHYKSVGSNPQVRYNLFNIYLQSEYDNRYRHGNIGGYIEGIKNTFGQKHLEYMDSLALSQSNKFTTIQIQAFIKKASEVISELEKSGKKHSIQERLILREQYNNYIFEGLV